MDIGHGVSLTLRFVVPPVPSSVLHVTLSSPPVHETWAAAARSARDTLTLESWHSCDVVPWSVVNRTPRFTILINVCGQHKHADRSPNCLASTRIENLARARQTRSYLKGHRMRLIVQHFPAHSLPYHLRHCLYALRSQSKILMRRRCLPSSAGRTLRRPPQLRAQPWESAHRQAHTCEQKEVWIGCRMRT
jgi:hypothetical protein